MSEETKEKLPDISFTDSTYGHKWIMKLSVGLIEDIQEAINIDLDGIIREPRKFSEMILAEPRKLAELLWCMCEDQAKQKGIEPRQFAKLLDRDTLDLAVNAMIEAIVAFYPRGSAGETLRRKLPALIQKMDQEIAERAGKEADKQLSGKLMT